MRIASTGTYRLGRDDASLVRVAGPLGKGMTVAQTIPRICHASWVTGNQAGLPLAMILGPHGGSAWTTAWSQGLVETELPYGAECLREHGFEVEYPSLDDLPGWSSRLGHSLTRRTHDLVSLPVTPALALASRWLRADVVISLFEDNGFAMAPLLRAQRRLGLKPVTSVVVSCWAAEKAVSSSFHVLRRYSAMLNAFDLVVCFSSNQPELLRDRFNIPEEKIVCTTFGCRSDAFAGEEVHAAGVPPVLTVGNDVGRDYATFIKAVERAKTTGLIVTNSWHSDRLPTSGAVTARNGVDRSTYLGLLAATQVVVIPTFGLAYPTGQSVLIEAMASGKACVVSASPAMLDYVQHEINALTVPVGDSSAMASAISRLLADEGERRRLGHQARRDASDRHDIRRMWGDIAAGITRERSGTEL